MDSNLSAMSAHLPKTPRVLACVLCRQRKLKCDRHFPCQNCTKSRAQCIPGTVIQRQRKRRFPERELIERLRHYEGLLRQHNIPFKPLHGEASVGSTQDLLEPKDSHHSDDEDLRARSPLSNTTSRSEKGEPVKNVWHVMASSFRDSDDSDSEADDLRETTVQKAWDQHFLHNDDQLLLGSRRISVELLTLHPDPVQIFRFWQVYLDNVNPLLKVTHTPSVQGRLIEAASNLSDLRPGTEVLLFGIYCVAVASLTEEDCRNMFGNGKNELLTRFQTGCQQALWNCGFLFTNDRDCLTALYFYLITVRPVTTPKSLISLLGIAVRIAQRMGIDSEIELKNCNVLEAEMRRRLWWSLVLFDTRITEIASGKKSSLNPTWDCQIPLNVNDSDLRPDMKEPPSPHGSISEALFPVLRGELHDSTRNAIWFLDFSNPILRPLAKNPRNGAPASEIDLAKLSALFEERYFRSCDQDSPINFVTMWTTRAMLAKYRLLEHHWQVFNSTERPTEAHHALATGHALHHLEADIQIMSSPLIKGFRWQNQAYFPFPSYHQILQHVSRWPYSDQTREAWRLMDEDYAAWFSHESVNDGPLFQLFSTYVLRAWDRCEIAFARLPQMVPTPTPRVVLSMRETIGKRPPGKRPLLVGEEPGPLQVPAPAGGALGNDFSMPTPSSMDSGGSGGQTHGGQSMDLGAGMPGLLGAPEADLVDFMGGQSYLDTHMDQLDWTALMSQGQGGWGGI